MTPGSGTHILNMRNVWLQDTFHGTVVAVRNHCNVAVFIRESINAFKLESLLRETGLENRRLKRLTAKKSGVCTVTDDRL